MEKLKLNEIKPVDCEITLFDEDFTLRKFTMLDQNWLDEAFTEEEKASLFTDKMKDAHLARLTFHQMTFESQQRVPPLIVDFVNEDTGETATKTFKGWRALQARMGGLPDKLQAFQGLMTNIGLSRPVLESLFTDKELAKMKIKDGVKKKKRKATGRK